MRSQLIRRYFITGLLIWIPLTITLWVLSILFRLTDSALQFIPETIHPNTLLEYHIPGLGAIFVVLVIFFTGLLTTNFIGQRIVQWWEKLLAKIPVVSPIYRSVKQVSDSLFSSSGNAFRKAVMIQYPREGIWTIAFLTGKPSEEVSKHFSEEYISVFMPSTPNPTTGFFLMLPKNHVIELDMSVDEALKYIISMGVAAPLPRH